MGKDTIFFCSECGYKSSKWLGKCPDCNSWNTFTEEKIIKDNKTKKYTVVSNVKPVKIDNVTVNKESRIQTGLKELDRVLGGGVVIGSVNLVGGDPGIGKSTLLLQMCRKVNDDTSDNIFADKSEYFRDIEGACAAKFPRWVSAGQKRKAGYSSAGETESSATAPKVPLQAPA